MPLPESPLLVYGGCNCGAIRYKVDIPAIADRSHHPLSKPQTNGGEVRLPFITIDHCNDCRRATGAMLPQWLCTPIAHVSASVLPRQQKLLSSEESEQQQQPKKTSHVGKESWCPAAEVFTPGCPKSTDSYLAFYKSSPEVTRSFCGRCGTHLAYRHAGFTRMGFPDMMDILLGSVDREDLVSEWMAPERHLWVGCGIGWVERLASGGSAGLPRHAGFRIDEVME